ncbi:hypothetical protein M2459_001380 [Parabacteroides sp. PF5-5]|uniref:hypothetical protein n=1 Tax=unclassified Parabacteroides TaxID=2649774 RepID=UPI002474AAB5|nr:MULTISPECIES: hypothetical protein [unclassified Parabacteroides]MDH6304644.1 hypothetical protein [Parabacteroides sp. PH5-39]MDH6315742.1 hypothetical protein [Parabacteroides sp. PF5-13]MDH6319402.1 hypothetical protein [Parabacteroides sp. PH5-13]MDH6323133.1 hypothetical protein [Parabacteroides sp. PH5-8]MDH6326935.1 hypothetical protein [Parabacteroides sp. PH5-41]
MKTKYLKKVQELQLVAIGLGLSTNIVTKEDVLMVAVIDPNCEKAIYLENIDYFDDTVNDSMIEKLCNTLACYRLTKKAS